MMRRSLFALMFIVVILFVGVGLFRVKYMVVALEQEYYRLCKSLQNTHEECHILAAEWAHLNNPSHLQILAERYLELQPIDASQLVSLTELAASQQSYDRSGLESLLQQLGTDSPASSGPMEP